MVLDLLVLCFLDGVLDQIVPDSTTYTQNQLLNGGIVEVDVDVKTVVGGFVLDAIYQRRGFAAIQVAIDTHGQLGFYNREVRPQIHVVPVSARYIGGTGGGTQANAVDQFGGLVIHDSTVEKTDVGSDAKAGKRRRIPMVDVEIDGVG